MTTNKTSGKPNLLLLGAVIGSPVFILTFLIEGIRRNDYNPIRLPISSLSIGEYGWIQITSFMVTGFLFLLSAIGLHYRLKYSRRGFWGPLLIGFVSLGLISAGIFSSDPLFGYPAGHPFVIAQYSTHGKLHNVVSLFVFTCLPAACFVFRKRFKTSGEAGWASYSLFTAIGMFTMFILAGAGFEQVPGFASIAGIFQRLAVIIGWTWLSLLCLHFFRTKNQTIAS